MEEVSAMMRPALPVKTIGGARESPHQRPSRDVLTIQAGSVDSGAGARTVSILAVAPTASQPPSEAAGATVFVGAGGAAAAARSVADSPAIWRRTSVPEVQTVNGHETPQRQLQGTPVLSQRHQHQQQQPSQHPQSQPSSRTQSAQHVVKIRINPEVDSGRVISTVRLTADQEENSGNSSAGGVNLRLAYDKHAAHHGDNSEAPDAAIRRDDVARVSARNIANERDSCVRISVTNGCDADGADRHRRTPQNGHQAQTPQNGNQAQSAQNCHQAQTAQNGNQAQTPQAQTPQNCHQAQTAQNSHQAQTPQNGHQAQTPQAQTPQNCHQAQTPQNSHQAQTPQNCHKAQTPQGGKISPKDEMVQQRGSTDSVNAGSLSRNGACFYYGSFQNQLGAMLTSSGQCSPSDTLDSGTCSDLDGTPPPLPKKKNTSRTVLLGVGDPGQHRRTGSLTSSGAEVDSDDNESNISCDSLNGGELAARIADGVQVNGVTHVAGVKDKRKVTQDADLADVKDKLKVTQDADLTGVKDKLKVTQNAEVAGVKVTRKVTEDAEVGRIDGHDKRGCDDNVNNNNINNNNNNNNVVEVADGNSGDLEMNQRNNGDPDVIPGSGSSSSTRGTSPSVSPAPSGASSLSKASSTPRVRSPVALALVNGRVASPVVKECTYEERKREQDRLEEESAAADFYANYNRKDGTKYLYDDDRFYKFHINENQPDAEDEEGKGGERESDEFFAGYKILDREAIRSAKGTVRGVKNRVRAGIATFLQKPSVKNYKAKDEGKIVVYTTSMSIVRETYYACIKMLQILKTHMVKYEVRDMFMSRELQTELKERIGCETIEVPQLFIDGQYIGNANAVERLNESGELRRMFKPYKSLAACTTCVICGGCRLLPCWVCNGSKKSPVRFDYMREFHWLRCMNCDEVGLVRCQHC